jgi:hypothetical protein
MLPATVGRRRKPKAYSRLNPVNCGRILSRTLLYAACRIAASLLFPHVRCSRLPLRVSSLRRTGACAKFKPVFERIATYYNERAVHMSTAVTCLSIDGVANEVVCLLLHVTIAFGSAV